MSIPNELIEEIKGILEQAVGSLKNVESYLNKTTEETKVITNKLEKFEEMIQANQKTINDGIVPEIEKNFNEKFKNITEKTEKLSFVLNNFADIFGNLQNEAKQVSQFDINRLLQEVVELEEIDFSQPIRISPVVQKQDVKSSGKTITAGGGSITDQIAAMAKGGSSQKQSSLSPEDIQSTEILDPNKWTDSEIEGFQLFDETITGWKLRDFEKLKGTREMFAIAWRKLSSHDKKRIRNGAWSDPIIKKITLLGRSRFDDDE